MAAKIPIHPRMPVNEVYIDFDSGKITGECSGCTVETIARAFMSIGAELLKIAEEGYRPAYYDYDEGKHFSG